MNPITTSKLIDSLEWRYATKVFNPDQKLTPDVWADLEKSLVLTPSSFGLQPWKFIVITNQAVKDSLVEHSWGQQQVSDCSHMIVLCAKTEMATEDIEAFLSTIVAARGVTRESLDGYAGMMSGFFGNMDAAQTLSWAKNQVYIALGQLMSSAALVGVDACPMEGISAADYDRILGLDGTGYKTAVACPLGYRSDDDKYAELPKVRYTADQVIQTIG